MLLILLGVLCFGIHVNGQIGFSPNTYYAIPPENGCDGVWAMQPLDASSCPLPFTIELDPFECAMFRHSTPDTTFYNLCYFPCTLRVITNNGLVCASSHVYLTTSVNSNADKKFPPPFYDPSGNFMLIQTPYADRLVLSDLQGRTILVSELKNGMNQIDMNLVSGIYIWRTKYGYGKILIED